MSSILIVEDVAALREQYAYDLARLGGHETQTAAGVPEALEKLETEPCDCVVLDLEMPGADGFELLEKLGVLLLVVVDPDQVQPDRPGSAVGLAEIPEPPRQRPQKILLGFVILAQAQAVEAK